MSKVELVCIGEIKFKSLKEIQKNYLQRINYFVKFTLKNLKDIKLDDEEIVRKKEGESMANVIEKGDFVIALDEKGKKMNSIKFASFLEDKLAYHPGRIVFLIGGFSGLSKALDPKINLKLSFSDMTISHDLFKIVFLEQLYRAMTIIKGVKYHR